MTTKTEKDLSTTKDTETRKTSFLEQHPLLGLRQDVDSLFDNFFSDFSLGPFGRLGCEFDPFRKFDTVRAPAHGFLPKMDIRETEKEFHVSAELPGMEESDIELLLKDGQLIIKGEKKEENMTDNENRHLTERHFGSIYRSLPLPEAIDEDSVEATYDKGVLSVKLKKTDVKKRAPKTIKIKTK